MGNIHKETFLHIMPGWRWTQSVWVGGDDFTPEPGSSEPMNEILLEGKRVAESGKVLELFGLERPMT